MPIDPLNSFLTKQKCPSCQTPLEWGITTQINSKKQEICNVCKAVLGKKD